MDVIHHGCDPSRMQVVMNAGCPGSKSVDVVLVDVSRHGFKASWLRVVIIVLDEIYHHGDSCNYG